MNSDYNGAMKICKSVKSFDSISKIEAQAFRSVQLLQGER